MTEAQAQAHRRMISSLPSRIVADDDWLDDPKNWKPHDRPLTPAELCLASNLRALNGSPSSSASTGTPPSLISPSDSRE